MIGILYRHPIHSGPMVKTMLLYFWKREEAILKFRYLNGSLYLTVLLETSHLCLAAEKASSLISWKHSFPACKMFVWNNPNWPTTLAGFINCLCLAERCMGFVGSPLTHWSMPYSRFLKALWALAHFIWLVEKERKAWN